jgi:molecular chaperone DnaK (HSP70)
MLSDREQYDSDFQMHCINDKGEEVVSTLRVTLARDELEMLIEDDLKRIALEMKQLLREVGIPEKELNSIVLAGQSSKMQLVKTVLEDQFGKGKVELLGDLKGCVAKGAYWYGKARTQLVKALDVQMEMENEYRNRTASAYGIEALDERGNSYFEPVIKFGTPIPASEAIPKEKINISKGQEMVRVSVYENLSLNNDSLRDNDDCEEIGSFWKKIRGIEFDESNSDHRLEMRLDENKKLTVCLQLGDGAEEFEFQAAEEL